MSKRERIVFGVVFSVVVFVFLWACSGCATDMMMSWRSGAGSEVAGEIARRPMWQSRSNSTSSSTSSAASSSPMND